MGKLNVDGTELQVLQIEEDDYISLTDMVRKIDNGPALIEKWLRNKNTIEFLGIWEEMYNADLWFFVHGWSMVVLGIVCMVIVTMGYIFTGIPVSVICIADAMVKLICGIYLLFIAKPSKYIPNVIK